VLVGPGGGLLHRLYEQPGLGEDRERVSACQVSAERLEVTGEVVAEICETDRAPTRPKVAVKAPSPSDRGRVMVLTYITLFGRGDAAVVATGKLPGECS
jgi:hypothetical protein